MMRSDGDVLGHRALVPAMGATEDGMIARLTEIYAQDFSIADCSMIRDQLETFILYVRRVDDFIACHDLESVAIKMVETEKYLAFPLVYRLIELAFLSGGRWQRHQWK